MAKRRKPPRKRGSKGAGRSGRHGDEAGQTPQAMAAALDAMDLGPELNRQRDKLRAELIEAIVGTGVDLVGMVPGPVGFVGDAAGLIMALRRGNMIDVGLSIVSMIPFGDIVAKGPKLARNAARMKKIGRGLEALRTASRATEMVRNVDGINKAVRDLRE